MTQRREKNFGSKRNSVMSHRLPIIIIIVFGLFLVGNVWVSISANNDPVKKNSATISLDLQASSENFDLLTSHKNESLTNVPETSGALSVFPHRNQIHSQISCLTCHSRTSNSPRLRFPGKDGHMPCIGCHTQQFADNSSPICSICHSNTETGSLKAFPPLRSFSVRFDHSKHLRTTNCETCHQPLRSGVAKSIPQGAGTHATCFQCHTSQAKERMSSCSVCHKPGRGVAATPVWTKAFNVNFSHAKHNLSCNNCHLVRAGSRGNQMTKPLVSMHFAPKSTLACASCHNNIKVFGGNDFSDCRRCHTGPGFKFPPQR